MFETFNKLWQFFALLNSFLGQHGQVFSHAFLECADTKPNLDWQVNLKMFLFLVHCRSSRSTSSRNVLYTIALREAVPIGKGRNLAAADNSVSL